MWVHFVYSESSDQILIGEDSSGFYVCSGAIDSSKQIFIGSPTTTYVRVQGLLANFDCAIRLPSISATGRSDQDLFAVSSQPSTKGRWNAKAFRAFSFQYSTYGEFGWDENNADVEIVNSYEGDATYGGWRFLSGASKVLRAFLSGLGKLVLDNTLVFAPEASTTLATNGQMTFERVSNTEVRVKLRGSDGTSRSVTLTLS